MKRLLAALVLPSMIMLTTSVNGELLRVDQATFGMDCAPCAYGIERGLHDLPGVDHVQVSLNQAKAVIDLEPGNSVTLQAIRQVIRDGGFSPREATVQVAGRLLDERGHRLLVLESGERYLLKAGDGEDNIQRQLQSLDTGQQVIVAGEVPAADEDSDRPLNLYPRRIELQPANRQ